MRHSVISDGGKVCDKLQFLFECWTSCCPLSSQSYIRASKDIGVDVITAASKASSLSSETSARAVAP